MLLIDGVKYEAWTPSSEEEFERVVGEHAQEIFGEGAKFFDLKHKLASRSGTGSIPDGYVISFGSTPQLHIIELELASHSLQHIVTQVVNIISGIENPATQQKICNVIEDEINQDEVLSMKLAKAIKPVSAHRFLSDCFSKAPPINIIIDKNSPALEEALSKVSYPHKIIEVQTFVREGVGLTVHAHSFEPLYEPAEVETINLPDGSREWVEDGIRWVREGTYDNKTEAESRCLKLKEEGYKAEWTRIPSEFFKDPYWKDAKKFVVYRAKDKVNKPEAETESAGDSVEITLSSDSVKCHYILVPSPSRHLFPESEIIFELLTEPIGTIQTRLSRPYPSTVLQRMGAWFKAYPELKAGDKVRITVIEPKKKYRLEIVK